MTAPDSADLPALIRNAFDALPGPDEERLAELEPRLTGRLRRQPRRSRRLGWLFWLVFLAGGTAAAAWWVTDLNVSDRSARAPLQDQQLRGEGGLPTEHRDGAIREESNGNRPSPVIYKREAH